MLPSLPDTVRGVEAAVILIVSIQPNIEPKHIAKYLHVTPRRVSQSIAKHQRVIVKLRSATGFPIERQEASV